MFLFLILPIVVSGFIVCNKNHRLFFRLHRYEGQHLYLKSAHLGLTQLFIAVVSALFLSWLMPSNICFRGFTLSIDLVSFIDDLVEPLLSDKLKSSKHTVSWLLIISIWTIILAHFTSALSNESLERKLGSAEKAKIVLMADVLRDSPIDNLFFQSYITQRPLLLTLENGKIYVGTISTLGEPNEAEGMDQEISIIPLLSGYRSTNKQKVKFSTDYQIIDSDLNIVIRQDKVITASWFDFDVYKQLNSPRVVASA